MRLPTLPRSLAATDDASHVPTPGGVTENARRWWNWLNHRVFEPGELDTVVRALREFYEKEGPFDGVFPPPLSLGSPSPCFVVFLLRALSFCARKTDLLVSPTLKQPSSASRKALPLPRSSFLSSNTRTSTLSGPLLPPTLPSSGRLNRPRLPFSSLPSDRASTGATTDSRRDGRRRRFCT
jgi:hypothetical protein